jgi:hypothetical protein
MQDPDAFFQVLGEQLSDDVAVLTAQLEGQAPPGETFLARIGRLNTAALTAREQVLREGLPPAEDEPTDR